MFYFQYDLVKKYLALMRLPSDYYWTKAELNHALFQPIDAANASKNSAKNATRTLPTWWYAIANRILPPLSSLTICTFNNPVWK